MERTETRVGYIGLGAMGGAMATQLIKAGLRQVTVFDVDNDAVDRIVAAGATRGESPEHVARESDVVITSLPHPDIIESTVFGEHGIAKGLKEGGVYVDMSTSGLTSTRDLGKRLSVMGVSMIDAPVGKGPWAAEKGELTIMCGGKRSECDSLRWLFDIMGSDVHYCGKLGAGQAAKLANNLVSCANISVLAEAYTLAVRAGVDIDVLMKVMPGTSADSWQLRHTLIEKVLHADFSPMFKLKLAHKDMKLIQEMASDMSVFAPCADSAMLWYEAGLAKGFGEEDWGAIVSTANPELRN